MHFVNISLCFKRHGRIWQEQSWQNNKWYNTTMVTWYCHWYWYCDNDIMNSGHSFTQESEGRETAFTLFTLDDDAWKSHLPEARGETTTLPLQTLIDLYMVKFATFEQTQWHFSWLHLIPIIALLASSANPMIGDPTFQRLVLATQLVDGQVNIFCCCWHNMNAFPFWDLNVSNYEEITSKC